LAVFIAFSSRYREVRMQGDAPWCKNLHRGLIGVLTSVL
jgi:hypothetical protein